MTFTTGGYIYLDSSTEHAKASKGALISKEFPGGSPTCLHFWYHMYASKKGMGQLRVFVQKGAKRWLQYRKAGNKGNNWIYKTINLRNKNKTPFKVGVQDLQSRLLRVYHIYCVANVILTKITADLPPF